MLNPLSLFSFANAVFLFFLAIYSLAVDIKSEINQSSFLECMLLSIWSFSYTFFYVAPTKEAAWFWIKIGSIGWIGFVGALIWFFLSLTRNVYKINKIYKHLMIWIVPIILIILNFIFESSPAAVDLEPSGVGLGWAYINNLSNKFYLAYLTYLTLGILTCFHILIKWYRKTKSIQFKKITKAFFIVDGVVVFFCFCTDIFFPLFSTYFPPVANIVLMFFTFGYWIIIMKLDVFAKTSLEASEFILDTISDALIVLDQQGKILHCNKATAQLLKCNIDYIIGKDLIEFLKNGEYKPEIIEQLFEENFVIQRETDMLAKDGTIINTIYSASIAEDDIHGFMGIVVSFHDITQRKKLEKKLYNMANFDELTGLPNRRHFFDVIKGYEISYIQKKEDFAVHFIDMDGFKVVNDTLGHYVGDLLLIEVAKKLKSCKEITDFVARLGGDEFIMIQGNVVSKEQADERKEKIIEIFKEKIVVEGKECSIGVSIGVKLYSETEDVDDMLRIADEEMYADKKKTLKYRQKPRG